jgi:hypothetical protein
LLVLSDNIKTTGKFPNDTGKGVNFLLCPSCFWCASCLSPDSSFTRGPSCIEGDIESIPIAENEIYRFSNDKKTKNDVIEELIDKFLKEKNHPKK